MLIKLSELTKNYILFFLAGVSLYASYVTLVHHDIVTFSIFPILCLGLSIYCLHYRYLLLSGLELTAFCFIWALIGFIGYNAFIRVEYPELGSNFIQTIILLLLVFYCFYFERKKSQI